jgi:hypothetical protein
MTAVWVRVDGYPRWCRLAVIGDEGHATGCLARISAAAQLDLTTRTPDQREVCGACWRDLAVRPAPRLSADELGNPAAVAVAGRDEPVPFAPGDTAWTEHSETRVLSQAETVALQDLLSGPVRR